MLPPSDRPGPARPPRGDPRQPDARIAEAEREGRLGEIEGLRVSLAGAEDKLTQIEKHTTLAAIDLPTPVMRRGR